MVQRYENGPGSMIHPDSGEWTHLILKLRWMGLEDEAQRLQLAVSTLTPEERARTSSG